MNPETTPEHVLPSEGSELVSELWETVNENPSLPSRIALLKRLADVVCLPESRINNFERAVTADLLVEMLREANLDERERVARRLSVLNDIPHVLVRLLIADSLPVARHLIENSPRLEDTDLSYALTRGKPEHFRLIAMRRGLSPMVSEAIVETQDVEAIVRLLNNREADISQSAIESVVALSQSEHRLVACLIRRTELKPSQAYVMFWWADQACRRDILSRYAVSRNIMQDLASDVFAMAAHEGWNDPLSRKALQFIERRQRNRGALDKSPFESLEAAIEIAADQGMTRFHAEEISYLSGLKPSTGAKILRDAGGEGLAVLCKATGLGKTSLRRLWKALRRPMSAGDGTDHPALEHVIYMFDILATDRAQTVLRYWNWSLSSALSSVVLKAIDSAQSMDLDALTIPERAAALVFSSDLRG